jgi:hypothetical protein
MITSVAQIRRRRQIGVTTTPSSTDDLGNCSEIRSSARALKREHGALPRLLSRTSTASQMMTFG